MCTPVERLYEKVKDRGKGKDATTVFHSDKDFVELKLLAEEAKKEGFEGVSFELRWFVIDVQMLRAEVEALV